MTFLEDHAGLQIGILHNVEVVQIQTDVFGQLVGETPWLFWTEGSIAIHGPKVHDRRLYEKLSSVVEGRQREIGL
jgi:hypothetical protein